MFIGVFEATITSPSHATDRATRDVYAKAYLKALEAQLASHFGGEGIELRLLSTESGCIIIRAALIVVIGTAAGALILQQPDGKKLSNYIRGTADKWIECKVQREDWACKLLKLKINFGTQFYKTVQGDTLESVLRTKFNVKQYELAAMMKLTEEWYPHVIENPVTKSLKSGYFIAKLNSDIPPPSKGLQRPLN